MQSWFLLFECRDTEPIPWLLVQIHWVQGRATTRGLYKAVSCNLLHRSFARPRLKVNHQGPVTQTYWPYERLDQSQIRQLGVCQSSIPSKGLANSVPHNWPLFHPHYELFDQPKAVLGQTLNPWCSKQRQLIRRWWQFKPIIIDWRTKEVRKNEKLFGSWDRMHGWSLETSASGQ